jgi:hypothetical protein
VIYNCNGCPSWNKDHIFFSHFCFCWLPSSLAGFCEFNF